MFEFLKKPTPPQEQQLSHFEQWLVSEFPKQYEQRVQTIDRLGLLRILPESGKYGIVDIEGNECPIPEMEDITAKIRENKEFFEEKFVQGFTRLRITPFGLPTKRLFDTMRREILRHHQGGTLRSTNGETLPLDLDNPLFVWDGYENQEVGYFAESFDQKDHKGKTKKEILAGDQAFPGFLVSFTEENLDIPRAGKGKTIGGRKQLEAGKTPIEYLKLLKTDSQYQGESGLTIEEWAMLFLTTLREENHVIDDYQGTGSTNWNLGTYFPASGDVLFANWVRGSRQANVGRDDALFSDANFGSRIAVRV